MLRHPAPTHKAGLFSGDARSCPWASDTLKSSTRDQCSPLRKHCSKPAIPGAGEGTLPQDGSVVSTQTRWLSTTRNSSFRGSDPSFWPPQALRAYGTYICRQNIYTCKIKITFVVFLKYIILTTVPYPNNWEDSWLVCHVPGGPGL